MADENRLSLKVWVDNKKQHVAFAEADSDFVDILCSFLTLPLGTIIKLLSKNTGLGSVDNLYESIEQLDYQNFSTKACKNMLLSPRSEAAEHCEDLKLNLESDPKPREFYFCENNGCILRSTAYFSLVRNTRCYYCGKFMNKVGQCQKEVKMENDGVFVKKNKEKFIITNDFNVTTCSLFQGFDVLKELGATDIAFLEEKTLEFGKEEFLNMLKNLLIGNDALTNVCFPNLRIRCTTPLNNNWMEMKRFDWQKDYSEAETIKMQIKLIMNKTNNKVVCAEIEDDFAEQLFSFLTFPLASVLNVLGCYNSLGRMTNFNRSIQEMKENCFMSLSERDMLVSPKLTPFFGCRKQMLSIREYENFGCPYCDTDSDGELYSTLECKYRVQTSCLTLCNPKLTKADKRVGERFVKEGQNFLVTDDLHVTPISVGIVSQLLKTLGLHVDHLEKKEITVSSVQVCALLRAMLMSKTVLNDVLFPYGK